MEVAACSQVQGQGPPRTLNDAVAPLGLLRDVTPGAPSLLPLARRALLVGRDVLAVCVQRLAPEGAAEDADRHESQPRPDLDQRLLLPFLVVQWRHHLPRCRGVPARPTGGGSDGGGSSGDGT